MTLPVIETDFESNGGTGLSTTLSCNAPAGISVDDLLVLICCNDATTNDLEFTDNKTGWEFVGTDGDGGSDAHIGIFYKVATGSEGSSESVESTNSRNWTMFYLRISGVDTTTPINTFALGTSSPLTNHVIPGLTTDEDDCVVLYGLSFDGSDGDPFSVSGAGWVQKDEVDATAGSSACWGARDLTSQGASGTATVTCSASDGAAFFQLAVNPAGDVNLPIELTGTAITGGVTESEIVTGGETIIMTITGDTWVTAGATFEAQRQNIIDGITSAQSETLGWNNEVRDNLAVTTVVRTSDTIVTVTLSAQSAYAITANETITVTVPASALTSTAVATVATPTFDVTNEGAFSAAWASNSNILLQPGASA